MLNTYLKILKTPAIGKYCFTNVMQSLFQYVYTYIKEVLSKQDNNNYLNIFLITKQGKLLKLIKLSLPQVNMQNLLR